ncbi:MAG: aspartate aminotransferase family protein [Candidatus Eremiobacteraeota bacterium]|nr:aspartate aminotransferase family protein [Candidatus Eremiobacteraeota bacterium]
MDLSYGRQLAQMTTPPPGPNSRRLATQLRRYESRNITYISDDFPIFWSRAGGSNVTDVDQNVYVDMTAAFGVAAAGHSNARVADAVARQAQRLFHGMGDVHPSGNKVALAKMLCDITPGGGPKRVILATTGSEAIEAALKTAIIASGKPSVICFSGAYHGLTYGALAVTDRAHFRQPFLRQLGDFAIRAPYPNLYRPPAGTTSEACEDFCFAAVRAILDGDAGGRVGAVILEVMQARGGAVPAPVGWLRQLRALCDERSILLIVDEIYTGFGRTGTWFACEAAGIVPDLLCVGKGLSSGFPISACIGRAEVMDRWPETSGEAIHTSTFLGHPTGCEAALASISELREGQLVERVASLEPQMRSSLLAIATAAGGAIGDVRGRGLLWGVEFVGADGTPDAATAQSVVLEAMRHGVLLLNSGPAANVVSLTPPLVITVDQLQFSLAVLRDAVRLCTGG